MKRCTKCSQEKAREEFGSDLSRADGLRLRCRACERESNARYRAENLARVREKDARYYAENAEKVRERKARYRAENAERAREYDARRLQRPEVKIARQARARARRARVTLTAIRPDLIQAVLDLSSMCIYCGDSFDQSSTTKRRTWDHQDPISTGGASVPEKAIPVCMSCNASRRATPMDAWFAKAPDATAARFLAFVRRRHAFLAREGYWAQAA